MTQPMLSILIPTTPDRTFDIMKLYDSINSQCGINILILEDFRHIIRKGYSLHKDIELIEFTDNRELTIGEKREVLYSKSTGKYSWQIDSDDLIAPNAIQLILEAIKSNPEVDCITFEEHIDIDGKIEKSNHSLVYGDWEGEGGKELWDGFHYHRTPFMKDVIRTDIARSVPIPHIRFGEDHQWAQALKPHLKTEIHIDSEIYKYIYRSTPNINRYGIK